MAQTFGKNYPVNCWSICAGPFICIYINKTLYPKKKKITISFNASFIYNSEPKWKQWNGLRIGDIFIDYWMNCSSCYKESL